MGSNPVHSQSKIQARALSALSPSHPLGAQARL